MVGRCLECGSTNPVQFTTHRFVPLGGDVIYTLLKETTMSQAIPPLTEPDFYLQVEDFILNSDIPETDQAQCNEIRLFLLTLLNHYKQQDMA